MSASAPELCDVAGVDATDRPKATQSRIQPTQSTQSTVTPTSSTASTPERPALTKPADSSEPSAVADLSALSPPDLAAELLTAGHRLVLVGLTQDGRRFRPSDWAERLSSVMAQYRPGKAAKGTARQAHLGYSPLVVPTERAGNKCVIVDPRLRDVEPLAWSFCLNFARDNGLKTERL